MSIQTNFPAIKPTLLLDFANTEQLDPRITFTRASTATYYGTQTAMAEQNLFAYSQAFDDAYWTKANTSVTANTTVAPDGTSTADMFTLSAGTLVKVITATATRTGDAAFSVFVKANGHNFIQLSQNSSSNNFANFNITANSGVVGTNGSGVSALSISDVGNGWYRCTAVFTAAALGTAGVWLVYFVDSASASFGATSTSTGSVFMWGAQLEQRSTVTAYTPTTTQSITNYIPQLLTAASGVARFDHNPTTFQSLGLEIEESRTNLLLQSEDFSTTWTNVASTEQINVIVSPAGTLTGDKLVEDSTTAAHYVVQVVSAVTGAHTLTCYIKAAERTNAMFVAAGGTTSRAVGFNLSTGVTYAEAIGGVSPPDLTSDMTSVGNGWWRCRMSWTADGQTSIRIYTDTGTGTGSTTGDGYSGLYIWGAQLEAGAFATSYIPTVASQVTRAADVASMTGTNFSSWYNAAEGAVYVEAATSNTSATSAVAAFSDGGSNNRWQITKTTAPAIQGFASTNGTNDFSQNLSPIVANVFFKSSFAIAANNTNTALNGISGTTDTSVLVPVVTQLDLGQRASASFLNGTIRKIAYYPIRVTNSQLQALTS